MDLSEFNQSWFKVKVDLNTWSNISSKITPYKYLLLMNYGSYQQEISLIISRIETELNIFLVTEKMMLDDHRIFIHKEHKTLEDIKRESNTWEKLALKSFENITLFSIDIKSFFIFTRIFIDTLARIIRLSYGKEGGQLPMNMSRLLQSEKAMELDPKYFDRLKKEMAWYGNFKDKRDSIIHWLGEIQINYFSLDDLGFNVLKFDINIKEHEKFLDLLKEIKKNDVNSTLNYIKKTMYRLSKVILCISERSKKLRFNNDDNDIPQNNV